MCLPDGRAQQQRRLAPGPPPTWAASCCPSAGPWPRGPPQSAQSEGGQGRSGAEAAPQTVRRQPGSSGKHLAWRAPATLTALPKRVPSALGHPSTLRLPTHLCLQLADRVVDPVSAVHLHRERHDTGPSAGAWSGALAPPRPQSIGAPTPPKELNNLCTRSFSFWRHENAARCTHPCSPTAPHCSALP